MNSFMAVVDTINSCEEERDIQEVEEEIGHLLNLIENDFLKDDIFSNDTYSEVSTTACMHDIIMYSSI